MKIAALDVGGANIKVAGPGDTAFTRPFELWRQPGGLAAEVERILTSLDGPLDRVVVTMTGELCDCFETKADGVRSILESVEQARKVAAPAAELLVWRTDQRLVSLDAAMADPMPTAASNWLALAHLACDYAPRGRALLVDVGSTTTDIVPLLDGQPVPRGLTDTERLLAGELVYTGISRTPVAALVRDLPYRGRRCPVSAELFATTLDVHLILGRIPESEASSPTSDAREATKTRARERLARMICADRETFTDEDAIVAAKEISAAQQELLASAGEAAVPPDARPLPVAVISGSGESLAYAVVIGVAERIVSLRSELGPAASAAAPAVALAKIAAEWKQSSA